MSHKLTRADTVEHFTPEQIQRIAGRINQAEAVARRDRIHLWVATVAYRVTDPTSRSINLDHENLCVTPFVGCWVCEEPYQPGMERTACAGEPQ